MSLFFSILVIFWIGRIAANIASYVSLWRVKEYRFDRMRIHLATPQGRKILFPSFRRPPLTPKTSILVVLCAAAVTISLLLLPFPFVVRLLLVDVLLFPASWIAVAAVQFPTLLYHRYVIAKASRMLRSRPDLLVVGISGSYAKTSVKEYLATILSGKFRVLKTAASRNSPIGIAEAVHASLTPSHEIFVVEMGAYRKGEIREMAALVRPQIGIITAINSQHQDLFGSLENTVEAKYELIAGLRGRKIGIFSADDRRVRAMAQRAKNEGKTVWLWSTTPATPGAKFRAANIRATATGIAFVCIMGKEKVDVSAPVLGEHQAANILAAICAAVSCGMSLTEAARGAANIRPAKGVMQKVTGIQTAAFIDDTFNNNPDAATAALSFLEKTAGRKYLVFQPMIELGSFAGSAHREVGRLAGRVCDAVILTNDTHFREFAEGFATFGSGKYCHVLGPKEAASYLRTRVAKADTVLFKGKEAGHVLDFLTR